MKVLILICFTVAFIELSKSFSLQKQSNEIDFDNIVKAQIRQDKLEAHHALKIVGGHEAEQHIAPWIVSLQFSSYKRKYTHACGGVILNPEFILTAGHCLQSHYRFEVAAGIHDLKMNETETEQRRFVLRTFIHPDFEGGINPNDIGLVQLRTPLVYTSNVSRARLPKDPTIENGDATLYGWGSTSQTHNHRLTSLLQTMTAPLINIDQCRRIMKPMVYDTNLCTGSTGGIGSCFSDSGSPLTKNDAVIGIVAWGLEPCGNSPSVYTRVSAFLPWIQSVIRKEERFGFGIDI